MTGFYEWGRYPDVKGGKVVPLIEPSVADFSYSTTLLPKRAPIKYPSSDYSKDLVVMSLRNMSKGRRAVLPGRLFEDGMAVSV